MLESVDGTLRRERGGKWTLRGIGHDAAGLPLWSCPRATVRVLEERGWIERFHDEAPTPSAPDDETGWPCRLTREGQAIALRHAAGQQKLQTY